MKLLLLNIYIAAECRQAGTLIDRVNRPISQLLHVKPKIVISVAATSYTKQTSCSFTSLFCATPRSRSEVSLQWPHSWLICSIYWYSKFRKYFSDIVIIGVRGLAHMQTWNTWKDREFVVPQLDIHFMNHLFICNHWIMQLWFQTAPWYSSQKGRTVNYVMS